MWENKNDGAFLLPPNSELVQDGRIFSIVSPYPYVTADYMTTDVHAYTA